MKKLFICFALMFSFSFPLGSASTTEDKLIWERPTLHPVLKHGQLNIENVAVPTEQNK